MRKITNSLLYVGTDDKDIDLFEGQYAVPNGVSYNSYVLSDGKTAVLDTADKRKTDEWLQNLKTALKEKSPDYIVISHAEPDHAASILAFTSEYPDTTVVGNEKTFSMLSRLFRGEIKNKLVVKDGDELNLGTHTLRFIFAPMVHWPEVMLSYEKSEKILFSADAFGKFGTFDAKEDWTDEARRYYINIVGKYGAPVQTLLKKLAGTEVKTICPLHGPVLTENLEYYIGKYDVWSSYRPEESGVTAVYASVYGNTEKAAEYLAEKLNAKNVKTAVFDLARCDMSKAAASAFRYDKLAVFCPTYDGGLFPAVETFINKLKSKNFQSRTVALIENGSWAPTACKLMRAQFETMKNISFAETTVTVESSLSDTSVSALDALAEELVK